MGFQIPTTTGECERRISEASTCILHSMCIPNTKYIQIQAACLGNQETSSYWKPKKLWKHLAARHIN